MIELTKQDILPTMNTQMAATSINAGTHIAMRAYRGVKYELHLDSNPKIMRNNKNVLIYPDTVNYSRFCYLHQHFPNDTVFVGTMAYVDNSPEGIVAIARSRKYRRAINKQRLYGYPTFFIFDITRYGGQSQHDVPYRDRFLKRVAAIPGSEKNNLIWFSEVAGFSLEDIQRNCKVWRYGVSYIIPLHEPRIEYNRSALWGGPEFCWLELEGNQLVAYQLDKDNMTIERARDISVAPVSRDEEYRARLKYSNSTKRPIVLSQFEFIEDSQKFYRPTFYHSCYGVPTDCRARFST